MYEPGPAVLRCVVCPLELQVSADVADAVRAATGFDDDGGIIGAGVDGWFVFWDRDHFNAVCPADLKRRGMPTSLTGEIVMVGPPSEKA